jgi:hypothetical protein
MLLKPLALPPRLNEWAVTLVGAVVRFAAGRPPQRPASAQRRQPAT